MILRKDDNIIGIYSLKEYVDEIKNGKCHNARNKAYRDSFHAKNHEHGWMGLEDFAKESESSTNATLRAIEEGWPQGVKLMGGTSSLIDLPIPRSIRRRMAWTDHGDEIEMQRVWAGNIDQAWRRSIRMDSVGPQRVRILVDSIASGAMDAETMAWRGIAAMRLCDLLTDAGYNVQVESVFTGRADGKYYHLSVTVKEYQAPLDLASLSATTALPSFFRALGHEWHYIAAPKSIGENYGYSLPGTQLEHFKTDDCVTTFLVEDVNNAEDAASWIKNAVHKLENIAGLAKA